MKLKILLIFFAGIFTLQTPAQIAIKADILYTMSGSPIRDAVVIIKNGKIDQAGPANAITIPAEYKTYNAKVVTPGLIDAHTVVGFSGSLNIPADQDQLEKSSPIQPELRAIDAYNPEEALVKAVRENGVTTIHTGHGIGALISGQTMIAKTKPGTVESVTIDPGAMLAMTIGPAVGSNFTSPGTRAKQMALLRTELIKAQGYQKKKREEKDTSKQGTTDLRLEVLAKLLNREIRALVTANRVNDIMNAIRLQKEFGFDMVLNGAAEAYRIIPEIKAAKLPVILHATQARNFGDMINMTRESAALLTAAGIPVSIESGFESYVPKTRLILGEAAIAVANGLSLEEGLKTITINPARLLGIDKRVGSIEPGKDADLVLYNGDPFEYLTKVCLVIIDGMVVSELCN